MLDTHCASQYAPYRQRAQASRVATAAAAERAKMLLAQLLFRAVLSRLEAIRLALCGAGPFFVHHSLPPRVEEDVYPTPFAAPAATPSQPTASCKAFLRAAVVRLALPGSKGSSRAKRIRGARVVPDL